MGQPFIGEIRMFGGNFAPVGWAFCNGQLIPISENSALYALIGTTYCGDGQATFALPDLQSRVPIHQGTVAGNTYVLGQKGGVETVTLTSSQIPSHTHVMTARSALGGANSPVGNLLAQSTGVKMYSGAAPNTALGSQTVQAAGGSQPHENCQPFLCISFIIALFGIFPQFN